jgi:flavin-dependent dehydrogenase
MAGAMARPGHVVPRSVFDARLVAAARERGAEFRRHRVRRVQVRDDVVVVDGEVAGRAVVAADGANGVVRRQLGLPPQPRAALALACRGYAPGPRADGGELEQLVAMTWRGWPAYAWWFPTGEGRANVGFGKVVTRLGEEGRGGRAELFDRLAEELPDAGVDPATLRAAPLPLSRWRPRQPDGRVVLAGDALSLVNPLTGEGIFYALASGRVAGEAAALQPGSAGQAARAALRRELGRHLRHTGLLGRLADSPALVGLAVGAAARHRSVFDAVVEIGLGRGLVDARTAALVVASAASGRRRA